MPANNKHNCSAHFLKDLIYGISHDMGAPIRHATQFSSLLQNQAADRLSEQELQWLGFIHEGGLKAQALLEGLLVLSRLETQATEPTEIILSELLDDAISNLRSINPEATFEMDVKEDPEHPPKLIRNQWTRLIQELVKNALIFQPKQAPDHQPLVKITARATPQEITLAIEDNGIGIRDNQLENCLRAYKQLNGDNYPGTGMGLTIVNFIAEMHSGSLKLDQSSLGGTKVAYTQRTD